MELRTLRSFLAVAEELHFGRAAERVGVSQPSLSQHIARLEAELGTALFERTSRRVRLTSAGAALIPGARRAVIEVERAARAARDAASGGSGELLIGALGSALNGALPPLVRAFTAQNPDVDVDIRQLDTAEQLAALQDRRLDVGFIRSAQPAPGLIVTTIAEEPLVAVLPADHPLAADPALALDALADEPFVFWPRQASVDFYDDVINACRHVGFSPRVKFEAHGAETLLGLIAAGLGVSVQPEPYRNLARTGVAFRPLAAPAPTTTLQVARRRGDSSPVVRRFLAVVDTFAAGQPQAGTPPSPPTTNPIKGG